MPQGGENHPLLSPFDHLEHISGYILLRVGVFALGKRYQRSIRTVDHLLRIVFGEADVDDADVDSLGAHLGPQALRIGGKRTLARRIACDLGDAVESDQTGGEDDASLLSCYMWESVIGHIGAAQKVDVHHRFQHLRRGFIDPSPHRHSGVVDQKIQPSVTGDHLINRSFARKVVGDVRLNGEKNLLLGIKDIGRFLQRFTIAAEDVDDHPFFETKSSRFPSDAFAATGDQRYLHIAPPSRVYRWHV